MILFELSLLYMHISLVTDFYHMALLLTVSCIMDARSLSSDYFKLRAATTNEIEESEIEYYY